MESQRNFGVVWNFRPLLILYDQLSGRRGNHDAGLLRFLEKFQIFTGRKGTNLIRLDPSGYNQQDNSQAA